MNIIFKPECKTEIIEPTYDLPIIGEPISKTGASANNSNAYGVIVGIIGDGSSRRVRVMTDGYIDYDKVKENYMEYTDEAINALTGITLCSGGKLHTGGSASCRQRRIADITVTEPVNKITVNKDINGNSFSLSEVSIFAYAGEAEESDFSYAKFLVNEKDSLNNFPLVVTKKTISCFFRIREDGTGMVLRTEQNQWNNFDKINLCSARVSDVLNEETNFGGAITSISIQHASSNGLLAAGTRLVVWGC